MNHHGSFLQLLTVLAFGALQWAPGAAGAQQASDENLDEIVVTGSRVITNGNNMPTPVTVVTAEQLNVSRPTTVFEGLLDLPVFSSSTQAVGNPAGAGGSSRTQSGLNLRGLGTGRTLVLADGHRVPPTSQDGVVDAASIPQQLLQRVDVVTGGVSAVYGSDAITGVVNFITDRKFNGIKAGMQFGGAQFGGDHSHDLSAAWGTSLFGGRGHIEASYEDRWEAGVKRMDRDFLRGQASLQGSGTPALPFFFVENALQAAYSAGGKIFGPANNPLLNYTFNTNGIATPFRNGITDGFGQNIQLGGDGANAMGTSLKSQIDSRQLFARFDFDLTDRLHYYLTGSGTHAHQNSFNTAFRISSVTIPSTNAFLATSYQTAMTSRGVNSFTLAKMWNEDVVPNNSADFYTHAYYLNSGLEYQLGKYRLEGSYTHSIAILDSTSNGSMDNAHFWAGLDAVVNPANGQIVCYVTLNFPGLYPGCMPINIFGPTADKDAISYFRSPRHYWGRNTMDDASTSLVGAPFNSWAGPVNTAVSAEWRRLGYQLFNDAPQAADEPLNCTGLRFNCVQGTSTKYSNSGAQRTPVHMDVTEGALEAEVPVLKDHWLQSMNVNLGARQAHYAVSGVQRGTTLTNNFNATTWKVGLDLDINDKVKLRATRSKDIRAPNLNELFEPTTLTNTVRLDTLTNQSTRADQYTGGNAGLTPEIGRTVTVGAILRPTPNFTVAIDGFDIKIENAIQQVNAYQAVYQNACINSGGTSFYCTLLERPLGPTNPSPANTLTKITSGPLNIAEQYSYGVDIETNYSMSVRGRPFSIRTLITYQPHIVLVQPAAVNIETAGIRDPRWRATAFLRYSPSDAFTVDLSTKYRSTLQNADPDLFVFKSSADRIVHSASFSNMTLTYRFRNTRLGQLDTYLNITNIFDKDPPPAALGNAGTQSDPGRSDGLYFGDDPMGRAFNLGVRMKL